MSTRDEHLAIIRQSSRPLEPIPTGECAALKPLYDVEAVLLDVYGTLFISACGEISNGGDTLRAGTLTRTLLDMGLQLLIDETEGVRSFRNAIEDSHRRSRQHGVEFPEVDIVEVWRTTLHAWRQRGQIAGAIEELDFAELSLRYELATNPVWPMPGVVECLTELATRGIHLGLISNAQWFTPLLFPAMLGAELAELGIGADMQFWSWRTGWAKPGEQLFRLAADALCRRGIEPNQALHVGNDMVNDILPAASSGIQTALFAGDRRSLRRREDDSRVSSVTPDIVLIHLRDLLSCVRPSQER